jgi:hypothetical protein
MAGTIVGETKWEGQRKAKKRTTHMNQKKKEKASPFCGKKLSHPQRF